MNDIPKKVKTLFKELLHAEERIFPELREMLDAPKEQGVYVIFGPRGRVVHVGRTPRAKDGIHQRLKNHMSGLSSFTYNYLEDDGNWLRGRYKYKFIVVRNKYIRAYLEAYAIGKLCPAHIGVG